MDDKLADQPARSSERYQVAAATTTTAKRQQLSCSVCRTRKVKCDRVQPCQACCARGEQSGCVFGFTKPGDQEPIAQSYEIRKLRAEVDKLKTAFTTNKSMCVPSVSAEDGSLWRGGSALRSNEKYDALERVFSFLRSGSDQDVQNIILQIRSNRSVEDIAAFSTNHGLASVSTQNNKAEWERIETEERRIGIVGAEDQNSRIGRYSSPSLALPQPISQSAVKDVFLECWLDANFPVTPSNYSSSNTIRVALDARPSLPILSEAYQSVSTTFFGRSIGDPRIVFAGQKIYTNVLRGLQKALSCPSQSRSAGTLLTATLLMIYETIQHTSNGATISHLIGILKLIEFRGPESHVSGVEHMCFVELRLYWVVASILCRSPTFLAKDEWKSAPWSTGSSSKDLVQHLLDVAVDIPSVLAQFDNFVEATKGCYLSSSDSYYQQTMLSTSLADTKRRLQQWKRQWADTYPFGQPYEVPAQNEDLQRPAPFSTPGNLLPTFRCRDLTTMEITAPTTLAYPDPQMAVALCLYYASTLVLSGVVTRPEEAQLYERYELACLICRSMEYCMQTLLGGHINRVLFPLRVAFDILPNGDIEREWVQEVLKLIEKLKLVKWGGVAQELSTRTKAA